MRRRHDVIVRVIVPRRFGQRYCLELHASSISIGPPLVHLLRPKLGVVHRCSWQSQHHRRSRRPAPSSRSCSTTTSAQRESLLHRWHISCRRNAFRNGSNRNAYKIGLMQLFMSYSWNWEDAKSAAHRKQFCKNILHLCLADPAFDIEWPGLSTWKCQHKELSSKWCTPSDCR